MYPAFKQRSISRRGDRTSAFTLVEVLVAASLLGLAAGGSIWALSQANNSAAIARLRTGAATVAQSQIDLMMTEGPFNPQESATPTEWVVGTTGPVSKVIYTESSTTGSVLDPNNVTGQMTTQVTKYTTPLVNGSDLNVYTAVVTVQFTYRGKPYQVQLNAMRASDV